MRRLVRCTHRMTEMSPSRGSVFSCRNLTVIFVLVLIVMWYLPKEKEIYQRRKTTEDGWTMYPRHWVYSDKVIKTSEDKSFSVMSYNVLNSGFIVSGTYNYCPPHLLPLHNRHPRIMVEVATTDPDIVSMMEVDTEHYASLLNPDMLKMGYNGAISADPSTRVGQATFWKKDKFRLVRREHHFFHHLAKKYVDNAVDKKTLKEEEKEVFLKWMERPKLLLITVLQEVTSGLKVVVGAVHITWDILQLPTLQMMEIAVSLQALQEVSQSVDAGSIIMLGDFNTPPHFPAYSLLQGGRVTEAMRQSALDKTDRDGILTQEMQEKMYQRLLVGKTPSEARKILPPQDYRRFGKTVFDIIPDAFHHNLLVDSAYRSILGKEPEITNADDFDTRAGIKGVQTYTLDYIWFTNATLHVQGVLNTPPRETILKHTGLPSVLFPSDHLPIIAKFAFK